MASFGGMLAGLRKAERELAAQLAGVRGAIAALAGTATGSGRGRQTTSDPSSARATRGRKRGKMSAEGRARIAAAQKARWAKIRAAKKK